MKLLIICCVMAVTFSACLQSLDKDLVTNVFDKEYIYDNVVFEDIFHLDSNEFGKLGCYPVAKFRVADETMDMLSKLDYAPGKVWLEVTMVRTSPDNYTHSARAFRKNAEMLEPREVYTAFTNFPGLKGYDDMVSIQAYILTLSPFTTNQFNIKYDTSKIQTVPPFKCGG